MEMLQYILYLYKSQGLVHNKIWCNSKCFSGRVDHHLTSLMRDIIRRLLVKSTAIIELELYDS